jgi:glycosyltransferase involved in cell wall biosynthesis
LLRDAWDISWHPRGRHVREDEIDVTAARMRGIRESSGDLLVFVDDDNVLAPDFLKRALLVLRRHPFLGI